MVDISNDSYLIIAWGSQVENVNIVEYKEPEKTKITAEAKQAVSDTKDISINKVGKAIINSYFSPITQNMASKLLPTAALNRVNSSLGSIIKDGKISNGEVFNSFKTSCTAELDGVASGLGLPSPSALYDLIKPDGAGLASKGIKAETFSEEYAKISEKLYDQLAIIKAGKETQLGYIKLKLVTSESESYSSSLPRRRTEKGFNMVDYVNNEDIALSFDVMLGGMNNDTMYQIQDSLVDLRNSKTPFDVYKIDKLNNKQTKYKRCLFSSLEFSRDVASSNMKSCSMSFEEIPEGKIETRSVDKISGASRSQNSSRKKPKDKSLTTPKKASGKKTYHGIPANYETVNYIYSSADQYIRDDKGYIPSGKWAQLTDRAKAEGYTMEQLGITRTGGSNGKRAK